MRTEKIGVLMGGHSGEREISLLTGQSVWEALKQLGYNAVKIDVDGDVAEKLEQEKIEIAFIALHGAGGEDGTIQGMLELMKIPYTGSGVLASAVAMNKWISKKIFASFEIPVPHGLYYKIYNEGDAGKISVRNYPVVVKPVSGGSTLGITIVKDEKNLMPALMSAASYGNEVLVEEYISGRELSVGVLDNETLPVIEIQPKSSFYDYEAKYITGTTEYLIPAELDKKVAAEVTRIALQTHTCIDCAGATRVDIRLDNDNRPFVLEINTIPGMTKTSLLPKSALKRGITYEQLVEKILHSAFMRQRQ